MASSRQEGPLCQVHKNPVTLVDGTLCRCASPLPGTLGSEPGILDHLRWPFGAVANQPMGEEVWFEKRYPDILEDARLTFTGAINSWVHSHWGVNQFKEKGLRINLFSRGRRRNDNRFEQCGDKPQDAWEADKVLGSFSLDIETPITVDYSKKNMSVKNIDSFAWTTSMYVEDVLGLQEHDPIYNWATAKLFPSRRVTRAKWKIHGEGLSYLVKAGDSLSKIALAVYGDERKWKQIHEANRSQVTNPDHIVPGQRLTIPVVVPKD